MFVEKKDDTVVEKINCLHGQGGECVMGEEFLQEHPFNEEYLQEGDNVVIDYKSQKIQEYERMLATELAYITDPEETIRTVVRAALAIENLPVKPEIIVEAALHDPEISAEMLAMAEEIRQKNIQ
jgi:hypothetical protein